MEQEDPMYVSIGNPVFFRKEILENAIDATEMLKDYERFKSVRERKTKKLQELRGLLDDMKKTNKDLLNSLPQLPEEKPREERVVPKQKVEVLKEVKIEPPKIPMSREEQDLTRELLEIQRKLKSL